MFFGSRSEPMTMLKRHILTPQQYQQITGQSIPNNIAIEFSGPSQVAGMGVAAIIRRQMMNKVLNNNYNYNFRNSNNCNNSNRVIIIIMVIVILILM